MEFTDIIVLPVIIALVEGAKRMGLGSKLLFPLSLSLGLLGGIFFIYPSDIKAGIFMGLIMGLAASGLWSGTKHVVEKQEP